MAKQPKFTGKPDPNALSGSLKDLEKKRRQVFKPILDNPYTQSNTWSNIEPDVGNNIVDLLERLLASVGKYNLLVKEEKDKSKLPDKPEIYDQITLGFNSTVSKLENQAQTKFNKKLIDEESSIRYVFVAKRDINPSIMTNFFPTLAYTASPSATRIKLVQLPKGTMDRLSKCLNKDNVGIIGLPGNIKDATSLYDIVDTNVEDIEMPWLADLLDGAGTNRFMKAPVKHIETSAPIMPKKNDQKKKKDQPKAEPAKQNDNKRAKQDDGNETKRRKEQK